MGKFVLVHGAWHGAWAWEKVVPLLEEAGHEVEAFDLPGHGDDGTPIPEVSLQAYADRACEALDASSEPAVLVGHSMGGIVISRAAEQRPDKVSRLVYLTAFLLEDGQTLLEVAQADAEAIILPNLDMNEAEGYATIKEGSAKDVLYHDCSEEDVERAKQRLGSQALAPFATPVSVTDENFGRVPRTYIECLEDHAIGISSQREMRSNLPCEKVITMDTSHSPFLSAPEELTNHLDAAADREKV